MSTALNRRSLLRLVAAAAAGALAGTRATPVGAEEPAREPRHVCKGRNECKGQGNCTHGCSGHGCSGKNDCKGKGGCASEAASHACAGQNECQAIGGCATGDDGCAGRNSCKGKGGCEVPLRNDHTAARARNDEPAS